MRLILASQTLEEANLSQALLTEAKLNDTNLSRVDLSGADLSGADLNGANLSGANLSGVNLSNANLQWTNLLWANLSGADLSGADLSGANLNLANLSHAIVAYSVFGDLDLSGTKGLETTYHRGPSTIGIDTIYRSKGKIAEAFLRGAGVPDVFIHHVASLTEEESQYCSCFISYAFQDEAFAEHLYNDLQQNGIRCWFAPKNLNIGANIHPTTDETVRVHDKLLLVLSEHSVKSQWIEQEVETAMAQELQHGELILFPMCLNETIKEVNSQWLTLILDNRDIEDFSQWQNTDAYQQAFQRLLSNLKV